MQLRALTQAQVQRFKEQSYLLVNDQFSQEEVLQLQHWVDDLSLWPETPMKWMKYFEEGKASSRQLCRIEYFLDYHDGLERLVNGPSTLAALSQLMSEPVTLFKEKINLKLPGGGGFTAHQDAPAFSDFGPEYHVTMMISVDPSHSGNGGLEFSHRLPIGERLPQSSDGVIAPSTANAMDWFPLPTQAGDVVFFDSYIPHRSPMNHSSECRRVLYITYNRLRDGDVRASYYRQKRACFPPDCERLPGIDYAASAGQFNVGNPIK